MDLPGWTGPATITDMSEADRGIIIVDYRGRKLVCDPQNLRQHLAFLCFFFSMAPLDHPCTQAVQHLYIQIANLPAATTIHLGYFLKGNVWQLTKDTAKHTHHYGTQQDYYRNYYTPNTNTQQQELAIIRPKSLALQTKQWVTTAKHC